MTLKVYNSAPYYDDFAEDKKFYRVLYRPGVAVQARELTQMQTIINEQVARFGRHIFKEGSMVIPGGTTLDLEYGYIKVEDLFGGIGVSTYLNEFIGTNITGGTSGVTAKVVGVAAAGGSDPITLFVKYTNSGTNTTTKTFAASEVLTSDGSNSRQATIRGSASTPVGFGSAVSVARGIYYVEDMFVLVEDQTLVLDKYTNTPTYKIGFNIVQTAVTSQSDSSLNDNANGSPNFAAPGAHRYSIELVLAKKASGASTENFVQVMEVESGSIRSQVRATDYSVIEETLARRTFDESGNYTVKAFSVEVREHLKSGNNRGIYATGSADKLAIGMESGKAYVRGYEIETLSTTYVDVDKTRNATTDVGFDNNVAIPFNLGSFVYVTRLYGIPNLTSLPIVSLRNTAVSGSDGTAAGSELGTARVRAIEHFSGTVGTTGAVYKLFLFDVKMSGVNTFASVRSVFVAGTPPTTSNIVLQSGNAVLQEPAQNNMLVRMPYSVIKSVTDSNLSFRKVYTGSTTGNSTSIPADPNSQFSSYTSRDYLFVVTSTGAALDLTGKVTFGANGSSVIINTTGITTGSAFVLVATVYKQVATIKAKSLVSNFNHTIASPNTVANSYDSLGKADAYVIKNIYMSPGLGTAPTTSHTNVTSRYELDNGQRDNFYDVGRIKLKSGVPAPTGQLLVVFDYFNHSDGEFFVKDSYGIPYEDIPSYQSRTETFSLRDTIDFRPRISDDGTSFSGTGALSVRVPKIDDSIRCDLEYYLARIDKIFLDSKGAFGVVKGVSSLNPSPPKNPDDAMVLYELYLRPYIFSTQDVTSTQIDNRRYTMRDIGRLEQRIKNLEYYTSLSLLEKETADLQILDSNNVDRFKNGFIVDPFYGHNIGNPSDPTYHIAIDAERGEARPQFYEDSVRLQYNTGASSNVQKTGDVLTLPYTSVTYIDQPAASRTEFVNPFDVVKFVGRIDLSPSSDDWKDVEQRPELVVDNQGLFDVVNFLEDNTDVFGTIWNEWQTQWTGRTVSVDRTRNNANNLTIINTIETVQSGQAREGVRTSVSPDSIQTNIGDRVIDVRMVPFIRSRRVKFKAIGLKPNTRVYPFFESIDVSAFCRQLSSFDRFSDSPVDPEPNSSAVAHPSGSTTLVSDATGTLIGEFYIPNTAAIRFRTGDRTFRVCDDANNNFDLTTTSAQGTYTASGLVETRQEVSLRSPQLQQTNVSDTRNITNSRLISSIVQADPGVDPLAQTFLVDQPGGVMITKIDIFFSEKDANIPITLQVRTVDNGYPSSQILPFGDITLPAASVNTSVDASVATTFTFPSPIFLNQGREYCVVLLANSQEYKVWISQLGENQVGTQNRISKQPTTGVLFKSQNNTTWTADQMQDLKYKLYRASFNTAVTGNLILNNAAIPLRRLTANSIYTTSGSTTVRVYHKNHGHVIPSRVIISGVAGTTVNNIPVAQLNTTHVITAVEQDWYSIVVSTAANATGNSGGSAIFATENKIFNVIQPNVSLVEFPNTTADWAMRITTGESLSGVETPYVLDSDVEYRQVIINDNYYTTQPYLIASAVNEQNSLASAKSFWLKGTLSTEFENVSPMIDLERMSAFCIANRIDNPQAVGGGVSGKNEVVNFVNELSSVGCSALARYVTRKITIDLEATALKIMFGANRPSGSEIEVYYKIQSSGSDARFEDLPWVAATGLVIPTTTEDVNQFRDYEYLNASLTAFTTVAVKVVLKSTNSSKVPRIKDFRVIALAA